MAAMFRIIVVGVDFYYKHTGCIQNVLKW